MDGFQWDDENILHTARHDVTQEEVEEVICGPVLELEVQHEDGEERFLRLGRPFMEEYCSRSTRSETA